MRSVSDEPTASASTEGMYESLDNQYFINTRFGLEISDINIFYFHYLKHYQSNGKGLLIMIGDRTICDWTNTKSDIQKYGYCVHLSTGKDLGDMCERCSDDYERTFEYKFSHFLLSIPLIGSKLFNLRRRIKYGKDNYDSEE